MNHLADETSPYLLQHKHNPVDWYPWGPEALERAERESKPIFLSIGYSACHWCHVMERESFEDPKIAATLNEHFVCIKVDREERPDVDEIYMAAVQALTGSGGWPMSVFMTPDRRPFFGGTYWPPSDRMGLPGFDRVVAHVLKLWNDERENVDKTAAGLTEHLRAQLAPAIVPGDPELAFVDTFVRQSRSQHDAEHGGFASPPRFAPKFPHAMELAGLLRAHARSGDDAVRAVVDQALHAMAQGGIYDQVGGGFHRYSVDREWLVPHFEKMLYDNALLVPVYAEAWRHGRDPEYARIVRETLDYLLREMRDPAGGFWSATDADSEGVEGKFFVWSEAEFDAVCGADAAMARMRFGVSEGGNWEGHNVLHVAASVEEVAAHFERDVAAVEAALARARQALYGARRQRVPPRTDDKVLASWTGLTISALCIGHRTFGEVRWLEAARDAADFVLREMRTAPTADEERRLLRSWRRGDASLAGYLEDHAAMALGLLDLFEADFDPRWLKAAREMLRAIDAHFADASDGSYFFTADDHEQLIARSKTPQDSSVPSGIAMVALAQLRLGTLLGDPAVFERGVGVLRAHHQMLSEWPIACSSLVLALEFALGEPRELVIVAERADDPRALAMLDVARAQFPPHDVIVFVHAGNRDALAALTPIVDGKKAAEDGAQVYVCRGGVCAAPITDPAELAR